MAGPDPRDRLSLPAGDIDWLAAPGRRLPRLALAYCPRWADLPVDPEVAAVVAAAVARIGAALDVSVTEIASPFGDEIAGFRALVALETDLDGLRLLAAAAVAGCMARFDALLTPTAPCAAFPIDRFGPGTIAGVPVAADAWSPFSYPAILTGLPVGLQIMGRHLDDEGVFALAAAIEPLCLADAGQPAGLSPDGGAATDK